MVQKYNKIKVLVTGSNGMLASAFNNLANNFFTILPTFKVPSNKDLNLDITNIENVKYIISTFNPDIILNCAAYTNVNKAENDKYNARQTNVCGLEYLINYSKKNTKIIHISTDYVFDGKNGLYTEKSYPNPINYYGKTKLEADNYLIGSNRKHLILRVNGIFSDNNKDLNFFNWVYKSLKNNNKINVVTDQISNPSFSKSIAKILVDCILLDVDGLYNFGTKESISKYNFSKKIAKWYNLNKDLIVPVKTSDIINSAKRPLNTTLVYNKICKQLNLEEETLDLIFNKYIKNNHA